MRWHHWVIAALVLFNAGWMTFDGFQALITGDYVTPRSGSNAGQLGPWAKVVRVVGLDPRSTTIKAMFIAYGLLTLAILACFVFRLSWAWLALSVMAAAGLWYLPIGTLLNLVVIVLLILFKPQPTP